ncbi:EAL domain-containing protein [uncultured Tateyamaria sp.]|uniref:sensor domain-containing phosphodiesterase n=1 Tax=uncultured Tateyamaria sp. TaxID=455651 RepID=UPI00262BD575|nr:EAL domain-containing protein [uncultured Tateyamaria sp.]
MDSEASATAARLMGETMTRGMTTDETINTALDFVRSHLGMEVGYLSEFIGDDLVFRAVSAPGLEDMVAVGDSMPLDAVYCRHILAGRLPELIPDTGDIALCQDIPLTQAIPIKAHASIPIHRRDGSVYGMFCCLSRSARADLNTRDLDVMRAFAAISAEQVNSRLSFETVQAKQRAQITRMLETQDFDVVYQPIMDAQQKMPKGFEALCRFRPTPYRPPNVWFDDAQDVGMQVELEVCVIKRALQALDHLPASVYLSVNASPDTVSSGVLLDVFAGWPTERVVLEVTEHTRASDEDALDDALKKLRFTGVRLAIDDAGAGYSGLQQIVRLLPDIIKLDISLTERIDQDVVRRSLSAALVSFAKEIGADIVAEGIETGDELLTLAELGVPLAQGYFLGRPADLSEALAWFASPSDANRA